MASSRPTDDPRRVPPTPPPLPVRGGGSSAERGAGTPLPPPPPSTEDQSQSDRNASSSRVASFLERARFILAEQRGLTPKAKALLESAAKELGLAADEVQNALQSLQAPPAPAASPHVDRSGGSPPGPNPPVAKTGSPESVPALFEAYVREALAASQRNVLSVRKERKLMTEGVDKLRLSETLARQIVHDVAERLGKRILSLDTVAEGDDSAALLDHPNVEEFLDRAAAILAEHRGINSRTRVLMSAAADELGLTNEQQDRAIAALQGTGQIDDGQERRRREREEAFCTHLRETLDQAGIAILTPRHHERCIRDAQQHFGVQADRIPGLIRRVAREQSVRIVSSEQAESHIRSLVKESLNETLQLDDMARSRLLAAGTQWGLSSSQVDAIIRSCLRDTRSDRTSQRSIVAIALTAAIGLAVAIVCLLVGSLWFQAERETDTPYVERTLPQPTPATSSPLETPSGREWWATDEDLLVAVTRVRVILPEMKGHLLTLSLVDPKERARAYRQLVQVASAKADDDEAHGEALQALIAGCYAAEPSDDCAAAIRESLLAVIPDIGDSLPKDEARLTAAFWAVRTALISLGNASLSPARSDALGRNMGQRLGTLVDGTQDPSSQRKRCLQSLCQHLYRVVIAGAVSEPLPAGPLYAAVTREAVNYLERAVIERTNVDFLAAVLPAVGDAWQPYALLLERTIESSDSLVVLELVELYEQLRDASLRAFLGDRLLRRAGVFPRSLSPDEVAQSVREALGAVVSDSGDGRWQTLAARFAELKTSQGNLADAPEQVLQQAIDCAHAATLACALAQGETGYSIFDAQVEQGAVRLASAIDVDTARNQTRRRRSTRSSDLQALRQPLAYLSDPRMNSTQRVRFLQVIARVAQSAPELEPEQAMALAKYLLRPKSDSEHEGMLESVSALGVWKRVRLALADEVLETSTKMDRAMTVASRLIGHRLDISDDLQWRQKVYLALLEDVLDELGEITGAPRHGSRMYDTTATALLDSYRVQARLLGVPPAAYAPTNSASQVLLLIIQKIAADLSTLALEDPQRELLDQLLYRIAALDYVAEHDVARLLLLQRLWLRILAIQVESRLPSPGESGRIQSELAQSDALANNTWRQTCDGEFALLETWLQLRGPVR